EATTAHSLCAALRWIAALIAPAATVTYTSSGFTSLRAARERPSAPVLGLTPHLRTARRLAIVWGVHAVTSEDVRDVGGMIERACDMAVREGFARPGEEMVVVAGLPFGRAGTTTLLHVA